MTTGSDHLQSRSFHGLFCVCSGELGTGSWSRSIDSCRESRLAQVLQSSRSAAVAQTVKEGVKAILDGKVSLYKVADDPP